MSYIPYIILFSITACVGLIIGFVKYKKLTKRNTDIPLKRTWTPTEINFDQCEILSREYYENKEYDSFPTQIELLDSLYPRPTEEHKIKKEVSVVVCKVKNENGDEIVYKSEPVYVPAGSLRILLFSKGTTNVYLNPADKSQYYFDLDFLK